jgi:murein L,D-transpeptidase YcbB/YkuD
MVGDADYLTVNNMELLEPGGRVVARATPSAEQIDSLRAGRLRLRQRPGPDNALGLVKFVFPNNENVYMHATPAMELFSRARRDFSHGCIRVERPIELAEWVLKGQAGWSRERIVAAMDGTQTVRVAVNSPVSVLLFYTTVVLEPADGMIRFVEDIYGHDGRLVRALSDRQTSAMK